jgi:hypothetical protein
MSDKFSLEDAQRIQEVIVKPLITAVEEHIKVVTEKVVARLDKHSVDIKARDADLAALKGNQRKALIGWGVLCLGVSAGLTAAWNFVRGLIHLG